MWYNCNYTHFYFLLVSIATDYQVSTIAYLLSLVPYHGYTMVMQELEEV